MEGEEPNNQYLSTSAYHDLHPFDSEKWLIFSYVSLSEGINIHPTYFSLYLELCIIFLLQQLHRIHSGLIKTGIGIRTLYFALFVICLASRIVILGLSVVFICFVMFYGDRIGITERDCFLFAVFLFDGFSVQFLSKRYH